MTPAQIIQLISAVGALVGALTAAYHAWQTRKAVQQAGPPAPGSGPAGPPSSQASQR